MESFNFFSITKLIKISIECCLNEKIFNSTQIYSIEHRTILLMLRISCILCSYLTTDQINQIEDSNETNLKFNSKERRSTKKVHSFSFLIKSIPTSLNNKYIWSSFACFTVAHSLLANKTIGNLISIYNIANIYEKEKMEKEEKEMMNSCLNQTKFVMEKIFNISEQIYEPYLSIVKEKLRITKIIIF